MAPVAGKRGVWNRALVVAVMEGHLDVCKYLVEDIRVDVNWLSDQGPILSSLRVNLVALYGFLVEKCWLREEINDPSQALVTAFC
jgi:hypothetical protein